jgi:hypothetical protein
VDNRVYDHATGLQDTYQNVVTKNGLGTMIEARARVMR